MSTLTIRIPDDTHGRLKEIARQRGMSVNKLVEELSTVAIAPYDAETRLRVMAARGSVEEGLRVLDKLDAAFARSTDSERGTASNRPRQNSEMTTSNGDTHSGYSNRTTIPARPPPG